MEIPAPPRDRSSTTGAQVWAPWPDGDRLQTDADSAWAIALGLVDEADVGGADRGTSHGPTALLDLLDDAAVARHRATAAEYDLIHRVLRDALDDPDPWVGPDPTLDGLWHDPRGRTPAALRRDRLDMAERAAVAEIAVRLRLAEQTVRTRAAHAGVLRERCPGMWAAFTEGRVSERHAVETARLAATLPEDRDAWGAFDLGALDRALRLAPARFATAARVLRERVHAESLEARHGRTARHLATADDETRTLAQLRADVFADLLSGAGPAVEATHTHVSATPGTRDRATSATPAPARPRVIVTIPALTLLGADDAPATLDGYGPIDLDTARRLAGDAPSWIRVLTHPVTGAPVALDRTTYRVPTALRRWLGITSPTCAFPGCARPTRDCDLDHLHAWSDGGATDHDNLDPVCRHHHRMRHETRWAASRDPDTGDLAWISPLGAHVDADPPPF